MRPVVPTGLVGRSDQEEVGRQGSAQQGLLISRKLVVDRRDDAVDLEYVGIVAMERALIATDPDRVPPLHVRG